MTCVTWVAHGDIGPGNGPEQSHRVSFGTFVRLLMSGVGADTHSCDYLDTATAVLCYRGEVLFLLPLADCPGVGRPWGSGNKNQILGELQCLHLMES